MSYYLSNDERMRYGVLGMKWGVRHDPRKAYAKGVCYSKWV